MSRTLIVFFPFAGSNINSFNFFKKEILKDNDVESLCIEYPGRGIRYKEYLLQGIKGIADDAYHQLLSHLNRKYVFSGHSMGGMVSYLVARKLDLLNKNLPEHFFISGCPSLSDLSGRKVKTHHLPPKEFLERIINYEGIPKEIVADKHMLGFFESIIRSDYKAYERYVYSGPTNLNISITIFFGADDSITEHELLGWENEICADFSLIPYAGNHFFLFNKVSNIFYNMKSKIFEI